jgi:3-phosphoglycerate kinase
MTEGQVAILPNLFDFPEDVNNDPGFAREIARSIDVYVNDSMRLCAQKTATIDALPRLMPSRGTGLALAKELDALTKMRVGPEAKFFLVVGGDRLMDKAAMIRALLPHADALVLGGVPANTVLGALGWTIGPQNVDASAVQFAHELIQLTAERELLVLPKDFVVRDPTTRAGRTIDLASMTPTDTIVDLGTETQLSYRDTLVRAHSVLWSGTMGNCNDDSTHEGTRAIGTHLTEGTVFSVITERKLVTAVEYLGLSSNYTLLSEGDAATLAFLSGERLTGLEALREP